MAAASRNSQAPFQNSGLLLAGSGGFAGEIHTRVVLQLSSQLVTDGILQLPETSRWIDERLGDCAVTVRESDVESLIQVLSEMGVTIQRG